MLNTDFLLRKKIFVFVTRRDHWQKYTFMFCVYFCLYSLFLQINLIYMSPYEQPVEIVWFLITNLINKQPIEIVWFLIMNQFTA